MVISTLPFGLNSNPNPELFCLSMSSSRMESNTALWDWRRQWIYAGLPLYSGLSSSGSPAVD